MTSKPSSAFPEPHRSLIKREKPEMTPEDEESALRIAAIDEELERKDWR